MERFDKRLGRKVAKDYQTVPLRIKNFWDDPKHEGWSILTKILHIDENTVTVRCRIYNQGGMPVASGHAEEVRGSSDVNSTSALENAETSAIGRALAALGLGGSSFASAEEVAGAVEKQDKYAAIKAVFLPVFENIAREGTQKLAAAWENPVMTVSEDKRGVLNIEVQRALRGEMARLKQIAARADNAEAIPVPSRAGEQGFPDA